MLKVTFWSSIRTKGGVTSNMLTIAMATSRYFHMKIGARSNHISNQMLDYYISVVDHRKNIVASDTECYSREYPQYMRYLLLYDERFKTKYNEKRFVGDKNLGGVNLYRPPEMYEKETFAHEDEEMIFMDLSGKPNQECYSIMEEADINVVMLSPDLDEIRDHFKMYPVPQKKTYYVVNGISKKSRHSPNVIRQVLSEEYGIKLSRIWFIPYYEKLKRACQLGEVDRFMDEEAVARKRSLYYKCVKEIGKELLMNKNSRHNKI